MTAAEGDTPCRRCSYEFNVDALGWYGCPNCHGEGLGGTPWKPNAGSSAGDSRDDLQPAEVRVLSAISADSSRARAFWPGSRRWEPALTERQADQAWVERERLAMLEQACRRDFERANTRAERAIALVIGLALLALAGLAVMFSAAPTLLWLGRVWP